MATSASSFAFVPKLCICASILNPLRSIMQDVIGQALRLRWISAESAGVASAWDADPLIGRASAAGHIRTSPADNRKHFGTLSLAAKAPKRCFRSVVTPT